MLSKLFLSLTQNDVKNFVVYEFNYKYLVAAWKTSCDSFLFIVVKITENLTFENMIWK